MGQVAWPDYPDTLSRRKNTQSWRHDWVNRQFITTETAMPQCKTFTSGLDFIERNHNEDLWFLQIEAFDPHEPFYTQNEYKNYILITTMVKSGLARLWKERIWRGRYQTCPL